MILLQAAIAAGMVLVLILAIFIIIGTPILTGFFMRVIWKKTGKEENIENKIPYYKDLLLFLISVIFSIVIILIIFFLMLILFDKLYPDFSFD